MLPTSEKTYTPGAERAARAVTLKHSVLGATSTEVEEAAEIISRETLDAEMLEALKLAVEYGFEYHNRPDFGPAGDCEQCQAYLKIEALIAKVEGR